MSDEVEELARELYQRSLIKNMSMDRETTLDEFAVMARTCRRAAEAFYASGEVPSDMID